MKVRKLAFVLLGIATFLASAPAERPGEDDWKYDQVRLKSGVVFRGLILEQTPAYLVMRCVKRKTGSPTVVFTEKIPSGDLDPKGVKPLAAADRKQLRQRLEQLKLEREVLAGHLLALAPRGKSPTAVNETLTLRTVPWPGEGRVKAVEYQSNYFTLITSSRPELVQLCAIQLEQVYNAYARALPSRTTTALPTTILLTRNLAEYRQLASSRGLDLFNPAFYDPARNQVICGSELESLGDELEKVRQYHENLRSTMKERRADLGRIYRNRVPAELLAPLTEAERRISHTEKRNDAAFARVQTQLFRRLYHEAFHAYLNTFVYPASEGGLPLWFNEGLAQIFETAIIEVGELRVGHPDPERLDAVRSALAGNKLLPLADLLRSGPKQYQVAHGGDRTVSDQHYLAAWAVAFYLTFEQRVLTSAAMDDYVKSLHRGVDPLVAFSQLVGMPLKKFESDLHRYLDRLRPDGTLGK